MVNRIIGMGTSEGTIGRADKREVYKCTGCGHFYSHPEDTEKIPENKARGRPITYIICSTCKKAGQSRQPGFGC